MPDPDERPPTPPTAEDGRSRLWRAFAQPTRGQVVVAVLLALVGFAGVTQVRTNTVDDTYAGLREQDLIDVLNGLAGTTQRAQTEISRLEDTRDDLQSDTSARQAALDQARDQADTLAVLAGTVPVSGPGIRITITEVDGPVQVSPFLDMVQALRTADAEAMQINDEVRVVYGLLTKSFDADKQRFTRMASLFGPATSGSPTFGPVSFGPVTFGPVTSGPVTLGPVTLGPVTFGPSAAAVR